MTDIEPGGEGDDSCVEQGDDQVSEPDEDLAVVFDDLRAVTCRPPEEDVVHHHLDAIFTALRVSDSGVLRFPRHRWAIATAAALGLFGLTGGLATAGALPAPMQSVVGAVVEPLGIEFPLRAPNEGAPTDASKGLPAVAPPPPVATTDVGPPDEAPGSPVSPGDPNWLVDPEPGRSGEVPRAEEGPPSIESVPEQVELVPPSVPTTLATDPGPTTPETATPPAP